MLRIYVVGLDREESGYWNMKVKRYKRNKNRTKVNCYIGKGKQKHFRHSVYLVGWIDLLGYGSMLRDCSFDPSSEAAKQAVNRLEVFHSVLCEESNRFMPVMQINDGAVVWRALSLRTASVTFDFLKRCIHLFERVNEEDLKAGYYGARMVLATGLHMKMSRSVVKQEAEDKVKWLIQEVESGEKDYKAAIYEAASHTASFSNTSCLQANFAFTKAYVAEGEGSRAGFAGNHLFIDTAVFQNPIPAWLKFDKTVHWEYPGLTTDFIQYLSIDLDAANSASGAGVLDTETIARRITKEQKGKDKLISRLR